jgi:hypothetical protein
MKRIEHRDEPVSVVSRKPLRVTDLEAHVGEPKLHGMLHRAPDRLCAVIDPDKRKMRMASRQLAGDLTGTASDIEHGAARRDQQVSMTANRRMVTYPG